MVSLLSSLGEGSSSSRKYPNWETKKARIVPARLSIREQCIRSMVTFCMVVTGTWGSRVRNCAMTAAVMASCITPALSDIISHCGDMKRIGLDIPITLHRGIHARTSSSTILMQKGGNRSHDEPCQGLTVTIPSHFEPIRLEKQVGNVGVQACCSSYQTTQREQPL